MDLNYLYHRQQEELMRADAAACSASRSAHSNLARLFEAVIKRHRTRARGDLVEG